VAVVYLASHKFVLPPCLYHLLQEIKMCDFGEASNGVISMPVFIKIRPSVLELKHTDGQMSGQGISPEYVRFVHMVQGTHNNWTERCLFINNLLLG
jgi:hypothetical protein